MCPSLLRLDGVVSSFLIVLVVLFEWFVLVDLGVLVVSSMSSCLIFIVMFLLSFSSMMFLAIELAALATILTMLISSSLVWFCALFLL